MNDEIYGVPNPLVTGKTIEIDLEKCTGCNLCVEACRRDVLISNPVEGKPPIVLYPDECWYCGCCVQECKHEAINMVYPLYQRIAVIWRNTETGEINHLKIKKKEGRDV